MVVVCHRPESILFDPRSTYSYAFTYFFVVFDLLCKRISVLMHVSTSVGDTLVVD